MIDVQCFLRLTVHHQGFPIHCQIVQVVRILLGEGLHLCNCSFLITHPGIDLTLCQGDTFTLSVDCLQTIQHTHRLFIVFHLLIELEQHLQHILAILVTGIDAFQHRYRTGIILLTDISLSQGLHINLVLRIESGSTFHALYGLLGILQERVILSEEEIDLRGIRIQFLTMTQQVEGGIVVSLLPLNHRFHKKMVKRLQLLSLNRQTQQHDNHQNQLPLYHLTSLRYVHNHLRHAPSHQAPPQARTAPVHDGQ